MSTGAQSLFRKLETKPKSNLSVCSFGHEKRGKTFWALSAPGPIAVISSDSGTESAVHQWQSAGKEILVFQHVLPPAGQKIDVYESAWNKVSAALFEAITSKQFRTVVIDTATEFWELIRLARFGRLTQVMPHHYGPVNAEFQSLVQKASASDKNSIWIHKMKKVYKAGKDGKEAWTGEWERSGYSGFGYLVDVVVEHDIVDQEFAVRVIDSRFRPTIVNGSVLSGIMCSFPMLAAELLPDTPESEWDDGIPAPEV